MMERRKQKRPDSSRQWVTPFLGFFESVMFLWIIINLSTIANWIRRLTCCSRHSLWISSSSSSFLRRCSVQRAFSYKYLRSFYKYFRSTKTTTTTTILIVKSWVKAVRWERLERVETLVGSIALPCPSCPGRPGELRYDGRHLSQYCSLIQWLRRLWLWLWCPTDMVEVRGKFNGRSVFQMASFDRHFLMLYAHTLLNKCGIFYSLYPSL